MDPALLWMFCTADAAFFDTLEKVDDSLSRYSVSDRAAPTGWVRNDVNLWVGLSTPGRPGPAQGWKIHVSVTEEEAPRCLELVWDYCVANDLAFKFLRSGRAMRMLNAKYASRGSSGKLITIYPQDDGALERALTGLHGLLRGLSGPYVLGDVRIHDGPLYVRYGAFAEMWCFDGGDDPVLAMCNAHGVLVPDWRRPVFTVPAEVTVPDVLRPHIAARVAPSGADFPYEITEALHFSNGGGVYVGVDASGSRVIVREARPHAGLDRHGHDAVLRLRREHEMLTRLAGLACVPRVLDHRVVQGHHFLVEEFIDGTTLLRAVQTRSPSRLIGSPPDTTAAEVCEYREWITRVLDNISAAVAAVHARGIRLGDLHPANVLIRPNDEVVLIDFEFAAELDDATPPGSGAPGFTAPSGLVGAEIDLYALASMRVFPYTTLVPLIDLDPSKAATLAEAAGRDAAMPIALTDDFGWAVHADNPPGPDRAAEMFADETFSWPSVKASIIEGILDSATPERLDRLYPGSPAQFRSGGFDLAHGAAGVLLALHRSGVAVPEEHVGWMTQAVRRAAARPALGLINGPHGVAAVLAELDRVNDALEVLDIATTFDRLPANDCLYGGHAGRALSLVHFSRRTGDGHLVEAAAKTADGIADRIVRRDNWPTGLGLFRGASGIALLFLTLHRETRDKRYLNLARSCLQHDIDIAEKRADGSLQLRAGHRVLPYLDGGSAGVALVLDQFLTWRDDVGLRSVLDGLRLALTVPTVYQPGLFTGRAGYIAVLARLGVENRPVVQEHIRRLAAHALLRNGSLVFPGDQLLRLSMDLATGSAGVLLALHGAFEGAQAILPYLDATIPTRKEVKT